VDLAILGNGTSVVLMEIESNYNCEAGIRKLTTALMSPIVYFKKERQLR